jgi:hypothetical protein
MENRKGRLTMAQTLCTCATTMTDAGKPKPSALTLNAAIEGGYVVFDNFAGYNITTDRYDLKAMAFAGSLSDALGYMRERMDPGS